MFNSTTFTFQSKNLGAFTECQEYSLGGNFLEGNASTPFSARAYEDSNCLINFGAEHLNITNQADALRSGVHLCKSVLVQVKPGQGNSQVTFWVYFLLRIIATMFMGSCFSLLDATTLAVVKRCGKAEYGKERMWSTLGAALVSPIAGVIVDQVSRGKGFTDYSPAFYLSNALLVCSIITFFLIELEVDKPEKGVLK